MDELLGVRHRQRLQQHRVDDGEDGRVRADADRQRQDGGGRESAIFPQQAGCEPDLLKETSHPSPRCPEPVGQFSLDTCEVRWVFEFLRRHASADGFHVDIQQELS